MKPVLIIFLMAAATVGIYYGSCYVMGGIEAGMPHGGSGKFSSYHEGNKITEYFSGGGGSGGYSEGEVTTNPFAE